MSTIIAMESIEGRIFLIRGQKVMLDFHLAELYGVMTRRLNEQVKRNSKRFPSDFMFQLTKKETENLMSQKATSSWGGHRKSPYAFTEQGIAMLSSVLNSARAINVNIAIMRAFVKLRQILASHKEIVDRLGELEQRMHKKDQEIIAIFEMIRKLMAPPPVSQESPKKQIGFHE